MFSQTNPLRSVSIHATVCTIDHSPLGVVVDLEPRRFLVQTPTGPRWLREDAVYLVEGKHVTLICPTGGVSTYTETR